MKANTLYRAILLPNLLHEILHCLPAWWWGLEPRIDAGWSRMRHHRTTDRKTLVILLMPAFAGLIALPVVWLMNIYQVPFHLAAAIFWIGWMAACYKDLYTAGYFVLFGKWHDRKDKA